METLAAFLRSESAKLNEERRGTPTTSHTVPRLRADLQVAATVLGQRPESLRREESRRINLRGVLLGRVHLRRAHYEGIALTGADFRSGQLTDIHLDRALLRNADFESTVLERAHFTEAFLLGAGFRHSRLGGAVFDRSWVFGADFRGAQGANGSLNRAYCDEATIVAWMKESLEEGPRTWGELREVLDTPSEENLEALRSKLRLHAGPIDEKRLREGMTQIAFFLDQKLRLSENSPVNYEDISEALKNIRSGSSRTS